MRLLLDVSAVPTRPAGAGVYTVQLAGGLGEHDELDLHLLTRRGDAARWSELAPKAAVHPEVPERRPARLLWEQTRGQELASRLAVDVWHGPHYTMPARLTVPACVTVHDLTFFDHPEWHERSKVSFFRRAIRVAAKEADAIVCVSDATARRLRELLPTATRAAVHVVPHGVDHDAFTPEPSAADDAALAALGLPAAARFVTFVGTLEPRKDVATLVEAFDRIASSTAHAEVVLVIAGGKGWGNDRFDKAVAASPHAERIVRTGYVPDEAVPALLRAAAAVVYPAIEEGFGLPAIEALACGAPTITTAGSVMDELAGGAAFTAPAGDAAALAGVLDAVLSGSAEVDSRRVRGLDVARRFTWDASAAAHEDVYESVSATGARQ